MPSVVGVRRRVRPLLSGVGFCLASAVFAPPSAGQQTVATGSIHGNVVDSLSQGIPSAVVRVRGTVLSSATGSDGRFRIENVPTGSWWVVVSRIGYHPDSSLLSVTAGATTPFRISMRDAAARLGEIVTMAQRLGETKADALAKQENATNIVSVLSGNEIRSLPNYNAAEAAGRIPSVSLERDEGEGKFVQVRGTEPRLSNVTIDGVHVPGTEEGDRIPKLDDVPSDLLGSIEVSKTLTADMDADAIGGSVNLVTKRPDGPPHGYLGIQGGASDLLGHGAGQVGVGYGGRVGENRQFGYLLSGSYDVNHRVINDVEPAWAVDDQGRSYPVEWSMRDYSYDRSRWGLGGGVDYQFQDNSTLYARGLWSLFHDYGTRYVYDVAFDPADGSLNTPTTGTGTSASLSREVQFRTPSEQMWGGSVGGTHRFGSLLMDAAFTFSGTRQQDNDYRSSPFGFTGADPVTVNFVADHRTPTFAYPDPTTAAAAANPSMYTLGEYDSSNGITTGRDLGGQINFLLNYLLAGHESGFKFGAKIRDEQKRFTQDDRTFAPKDGVNFTITQALSSWSDPNFYHNVTDAYPLGPFPDFDQTTQFQNANPQMFDVTTDTIGNLLGSFSGSERVTSGYLMNTTSFGALRVNVGVRVEATHSAYSGHEGATDTLGNTTITPVSGSQDYTDVFPSVQLRYAVNRNTDLRFAFTRGIARPNYSDLAPNVTGNPDPALKNDPTNVSSGNPNLKPERSWNYDILAEHYFPSVGVLSGGVFYKSLSDFLLVQTFRYEGPGLLNGFLGTQPGNGFDGYLYGFEADWTQHFTFLPGWLGGFGIDLNYTHTESRVQIDSTRHGPLLRQSPNIGNASLLYDYRALSARFAYTYNGPMITSYGDGSSTANGDNYFYAHGQLDGSVQYQVTRAVQMQFMVLNITNEVFGFFNGTPEHDWNIQREYYGRTYYLGAKLGFTQ